jgi:hypothetical protein
VIRKGWGYYTIPSQTNSYTSYFNFGTTFDDIPIVLTTNSGFTTGTIPSQYPITLY